MEQIIELRNISKSFDKKVVLDNVNLSINMSEVITIIGKSGVGKSVTLKLIMGLMLPDSGEILFNGKPYSEMSKKEKNEWKSNISFMFQNNAIFDSLTVFENIAMPLVEKGVLPFKEIEDRVNKIVNVLEIEDSKFKYPSQLSGGMQKRVALARALVTNPKIVLFDEPTTGLDPLRKNNVLSMISHNQKNFGFTGILVSHDVPDVFYISNKVAIIDEGKFLFEGSPLELIKNPHPSIKHFINSIEELRCELLNIKPIEKMEDILKNANKPFKMIYLKVSLSDNAHKIDDLIIFSHFNALLNEIKTKLFNNNYINVFKLEDWTYLLYCPDDFKGDILKAFENFEIIKKLKKYGIYFHIGLTEIVEPFDRVSICKKINSTIGVDNGKQV
jgi:phospholipid/cholesterol/gamma-HCH transport system ATP-binding protein